MAIEDAQRNAVVRLERGSGLCSGTLITPKLILTAGHCVNGTQPNEWKVLVGVDAASPVTQRRPVQIRSYDPSSSLPWTSRDGALLYLGEPIVLEAISVRPRLSPYVSPYTNVWIAGFSPMLADGGTTMELQRFRQAAIYPSLSTTVLMNTEEATGEFAWLANWGFAGIAGGDSGGPLAIQVTSSDPYLNGARQPIGVASRADCYPCTQGGFTDVTRGQVATWINTWSLDSVNGGHTASWHAGHGTNPSTMWVGERDYTGPCKNGGSSNNCFDGRNDGTDCDCDGWYDGIARHSPVESILTNVAVGSPYQLMTSPSFVDVDEAFNEVEAPQWVRASDTTVVVEQQPAGRFLRMKVGTSTVVKSVKPPSLIEPYVHGDTVFGRDQYGNGGWSQMWRMNADGTTTLFRAKTATHITGLTSDADTLYWAESWGGSNPLAPREQPHVEIWFAPFTDDPVTLASTAKFLAKLDGRVGPPSDMMAQHGIVAFSERNSAFLIRKADGAVLEVPPYGPKEAGIGEPVFVSSSEIWAPVKLAKDAATVIERIAISGW